MYTPEDSPFEKFRTEKLKGVAMSPEVLELVAKAYEGGFIDGMQKQMQSSVDRAVNRMAEQPAQPKCNPHPKAPHGFDRNASHSADRYVCECEGWDAYDAGHQAGFEKGLMSWEDEQPAQKQEPFGYVTVRRLSQRFENHHDQYHFYPAGQSPYLDNVDECHYVYTTPPPRKPWVGLTDEQRHAYDYLGPDVHDAVVKTEAKLREKNA